GQLRLRMGLSYLDRDLTVLTICDKRPSQRNKQYLVFTMRLSIGVFLAGQSPRRPMSAFRDLRSGAVAGYPERVGCRTLVLPPPFFVRVGVCCFSLSCFLPDLGALPVPCSLALSLVAGPLAT